MGAWHVFAEGGLGCIWGWGPEGLSRVGVSGCDALGASEPQETAWTAGWREGEAGTLT